MDEKTLAKSSTLLDGIQEKWEAFCDALEEKGVGIYDWFVNPLEDNGIPALPTAWFGRWPATISASTRPVVLTIY